MASQAILRARQNSVRRFLPCLLYIRFSHHARCLRACMVTLLSAGSSDVFVSEVALLYRHPTFNYICPCLKAHSLLRLLLFVKNEPSPILPERFRSPDDDPPHSFSLVALKNLQLLVVNAVTQSWSHSSARYLTALSFSRYASGDVTSFPQMFVVM